MTQSLTAQNPGRLVFDKDGDVDSQTINALLDAIRDSVNRPRHLLERLE
jgi:hypothetical protein